MGCFNFVWHLNDRNREIYAINVLSSKSTEKAVLVIISIKPLVLHWTTEAQEALWQIHITYGYMVRFFFCFEQKILTDP